MSALEVATLVIYYALLAVLCLFSAHRVWLLADYWWLRRGSAHRSAQSPENASVCVQVPLYNEPHVAERVIDAVCALEYSARLLEIQILDDSTDETTAIVARAVDRWRARGINISHIRRDARTGYKAGALAYGLRLTRAEFIAVFDADFIPQSDFLQRTLGAFNNPAVAVVQARWDYLNAGESSLTRMQSILLDAHFRIEHAVRSARGRFFNFNGTAGVWRRAAIDDAGGWQHDTLTEDLDISYRAQLNVWKLVYLDDVAVPCELPASITAYCSQQHRWAKGSMETARKLLGPIWRRPGVPLAARIDATMHMAANASYLILLGVMLLLFPVLLIREWRGLYALIWLDLAAFVPTTLGIASFLATAARRRGCAWGEVLLLVPGTLALGAGMAINDGLAAAEGLVGKRSPFVRTPKTGGKSAAHRERKPRRHHVVKLIELAMMSLMAIVSIAAIYYWVWPVLPFSMLFTAGFAYVAIAAPDR